jgi:hypothetical protein
MAPAQEREDFFYRFSSLKCDGECMPRKLQKRDKRSLKRSGKIYCNAETNFYLT